METSKYSEKQVTPNPKFIAAWERVEKALGIEVDPDTEMHQAVLDTLAVMAERIAAQEEAFREHERMSGVYDGR